MMGTFYDDNIRIGPKPFNWYHQNNIVWINQLIPPFLSLAHKGVIPLDQNQSALDRSQDIRTPQRCVLPANS